MFNNITYNRTHEIHSLLPVNDTDVSEHTGIYQSTCRRLTKMLELAACAGVCVNHLLTILE